MGKSFTLILILIIADSTLGLLMIEPANAQSTPEFTVKMVDHSYDVPTTYSIDPYTGENITHQGYHVYNRAIELMIKNQAFTSYVGDSYGNVVQLLYNIRIKGIYEENWTYIYHTDSLPIASNSEYTNLSYFSDSETSPYSFGVGDCLLDFPANGQVDFQVEAMIGIVHRIILGASAPWIFNGTESGWSNTQTITIKASSLSANPTPAVPEFPALAILPLILSVILVAGVLKHRKVSHV